MQSLKCLYNCTIKKRNPLFLTRKVICNLQCIINDQFSKCVSLDVGNTAVAEVTVCVCVVGGGGGEEFVYILSQVSEHNLNVQYPHNRCTRTCTCR